MPSLRERVAQIYYTHGLFCASHPYFVIISVICGVTFACYPLSKLPLPGNIPLQYSLPVVQFQQNLRHIDTRPHDARTEEHKQPRWVVGDPVGFVLQVIVRTTVSPWQPENHIPTDAFRPTLAQVFEILEHIEHVKIKERDREWSLSDVCLRVAESVKWVKFHHLLPQYDCLVVSPANLWLKDKHRYHKDAEIIKTVYQKFGQTLESSPTLKDVLFGVSWKKTGISKYFIRNRQRTISFAITIVMKKYSSSFVDALKSELQHHFPDMSLNDNVSETTRVIHLHYRDINYFVEYTPLLVTYFVILMYLYFSVRKIEMVKSKIGLAVSAVSTVIASLLVSVSVCSAFGLAPTLNGGEIFPYLVVLIGVENVLIITKSVVSTPVQLDVKVRLAKGLSREGWYITKNLVTELLIIFVGFFTFVPAIQEFCMFAVVGVLSDFFLQMVFFATTLSVDIRRMELADLHKQSVYQRSSDDDTNINIEPLLRCPVMSRMTPPTPPPTSRMHRSKSAPGLDVLSLQQDPRLNPPPSPQSQDTEMFFPDNFDGPRRLKIIYFWARTRMVQRVIMLCTVIWISLILYKTGLVDQLTSSHDGSPSSPHRILKQALLNKDKVPEVELGAKVADVEYGVKVTDGEYGVTVADGEYGVKVENRENGVTSRNVYSVTGRVGDEEDMSLMPEAKGQDSYLRLSNYHWPALFGFYNISLSGRYITVLPPILLSIPISPKVALQLRHPAEHAYYAHPGPEGPSHTHLVNSSDSSHMPYYRYDGAHLNAFYPRFKEEYILTMCLVILSIIVISYFMIFLYKCMCSRNYSRWRRSWVKAKRKRKGYYQQIQESVPLVLKGHTQKVECLVTDGPLIVSSCWGGQLRVWDSNTGECLSAVQRRNFTPPQSRKPCVGGRNMEDSDLYTEYHGDSSLDLTDDSLDISQRSLQSERSRLSSSFSDIKPDLSSTIQTDFSCIDASPGTSPGEGFNFRGRFEGLYEEHRRHLVEDLDKDDSEEVERHLHSPPEQQQLLQPGEGVNQSAGDSPTSHMEDTQLMYDSALAVWCLACHNGYIAAGLGNGQIEIWEMEGMVMKGQFDGGKAAVMGLAFYGKRIVAARLDGTLDFLELETFHSPVSTASIPPVPVNYSTPGPVDDSPTSVHDSPTSVHGSPNKYIRGHTRALSTGSGFSGEIRLWDNILHCIQIHSYRAHQQPINVVRAEGRHIVTASQDHTLKVFQQHDCSCIYTLHGHVSSVSVLYMDKGLPHGVVSGSADGDIRVWDLQTGICLHKFKGHEGAVTALDCSTSYIVSLGLDDSLSVWERNRGHAIHSIHMEGVYSHCLTSLTNNFFVTGAQGCLYLWDISKTEVLRTVYLGDSDQSAFVNHLDVIGNMGVVCDCGADIKVIQFPTILEKFE